MRDFGIGAFLYDVNISCVAYADDVALLATTHTRLQQLLEIANEHSKEWFYKYNCKKSEVVCFTKLKHSPTFWLGNDILPIRNHVKHLGIIISNSPQGIVEHINDKITDGRKVMVAMKGIGSSRVPLSTKACSKLYWSVAMPTVTYGLEVTEIPEIAFKKLEDAHWSIAKQIQHLPAQTSNPAVLPQLGWMTIEGHVDYIRLMFLWRLLVMPSTSIYKIVTLLRCIHLLNDQIVATTGPLFRILCAAKKYNILDLIKNSIYHAKYVSLEMWRKQVKTAIHEKEWMRHSVSFSLYRSLNLFKKSVLGIKVSPWWVHASRYPEMSNSINVLMRSLAGVQDLEYGYNTSVNCSSCSMMVESSPCHLLFECPQFNEIRMFESNLLVLACPEAFLMSFESLSNENKTVLIMSGLGGNYVKEHEYIYTAILNYVHKLYQAKQFYMLDAVTRTT